MMIDDDDFLIDFNGPVIHFADADASYIFVVIYRADQYLRARVRITCRRRNMLDDRVEKGRHIATLYSELRAGGAGLGGSVDEGTVQLLVVSVQIHEQLKYLIYHLNGSCLRAVTFIDTYDHG